MDCISPRAKIASLAAIFFSAPIGASFVFAIALFFVLIAPLSCAWLAWTLHAGGALALRRHPALTLCTLAELAFFVRYLAVVVPALRRPVATPPTLSPLERMRLLESILSEIPAAHLPAFMSRWFGGTPIESLRRSDLVAWVAYSLWARHVEQLSPEDRAEAEALVAHFLRLTGLDVRDGGGDGEPAAPLMRHTLDAIVVWHRPLLYYAIVQGILDGVVCTLAMRCLGFKYRRCSAIHMGFWVRQVPPLATRAASMPILFFHGVGIGLLPYLGLIHSLVRANRSRTVICAVLPSCTSRVPRVSVTATPTASQLVRATLDLLTNLDIARVSVVGHSFGTACAAWLVRAAPAHVERLVLLDPIVFNLHYPTLVHSFFYRFPQTLWQFVMFWGASREPGIAYMMGRCFPWHEGVLFSHMLEEVHKRHEQQSCVKDAAASLPRAGVCTHLAERDCLIDADTIRQCLERERIHSVVAPGHVHGSVMVSPSSWAQIAGWLRDASEQDAAAPSVEPR